MTAWTVRRLGHLISIKHGFAFRGEYFVDHETENVVLTPGNFAIGGGFQIGKPKYYDGPIPDEYALKGGELVITMTDLSKSGDTLGYTAFVPKCDKLRYLHNQRIGLIRAKNENIDLAFLAYCTRTKRYQRAIVGSASGSTVKHTSPKKIYEIEMLIPEPKIQSRIASVLLNYDRLIENNDKRIRVLEDVVRLLYTQWFVKFRFPGPKSARLVETNTPLGAIPTGWTIAKLGDVADLNVRSIRRGKEPKEINYVDIAGVDTGAIKRIQTMPFASSPGRARRLVQHGDIIWSNVRPGRRAYSLIISPASNLVVSTGFTVISPSTVPFAYIYQAITTDSFVGYLANHARGAAYPAVTRDDFANATVIIPDRKLLEKYQSAVEALLQEKEVLANVNVRLSQIRDALVPQLVTGIREVK